MRFLLSGYTPNPASRRHLAPFLLLILAGTASGFGSMGPISASFGDSGLFCAIDASGKQAVLCWDSDNTSATAASHHDSTVLPSMAALSGGEDFLCGILSNTSQAICWDSTGLSRTLDLVPQIFRPNAYFHIAAGKDHVCAIRGSYYSDIDSGNVDCWDIIKDANNSLTSAQSSRFFDQIASTLVFKKLVSSNGFTCGITRDGGLTCWGPNSSSLGISAVLDNFLALASGLNSIRGISQTTREIQCWGDSNSYKNLPVGIRFMSAAARLELAFKVFSGNRFSESVVTAKLILVIVFFAPIPPRFYLKRRQPNLLRQGLQNLAGIAEDPTRCCSRSRLDEIQIIGPFKIQLFDGVDLI